MVVDVTENKYLIGEINFDEPIDESQLSLNRDRRTLKS